jgi:hypothetical protein
MPYIVPTPPTEERAAVTNQGELERDLEALFATLMQSEVLAKIA